MRVVPLILSASAVALMLTGCSGPPVIAANIALDSPDDSPLLLARIYGPMLLTLLSLVVGVVVIVTMLTMFRAARAGRRVRGWSVVVSVVLAAVMTALSALLLALDASTALAFIP